MFDEILIAVYLILVGALFGGMIKDVSLDKIRDENVVLKAADDKLAQEIVALEVGHLTPLADYFIITHGKNEKQVQAIVDAIEEEVHKEGFEVKSIEGKDNARWILMDLNDVIVHVFYYEDREYYNLEKLWNDAPIVNIASEKE